MLVDAERRGVSVRALARDDDVAIAAVSVAELLVGVELADRRHAPRRMEYVEAIVEDLRIEDYDLEVARVHAGLLAQGRRAGRSKGAHDLMIAATAVARDRTVVTTDPSGFEGLPGVEVRVVGR